MRDVWNLGMKVRDLDGELAFLEACGARDIQKRSIRSGGVEHSLGMAFLGDQRILMFPRTIYEDSLPEPLHYGLTHAVYEVEDVARGLAQLREKGVTPFWGPTDGPTPFGRRRMAFFRSPSGFIFEIFQTLD
jgi:catechol 2,3-dioxygenase-like lactoylglutathione lyase family enzyme